MRTTTILLLAVLFLASCGGQRSSAYGWSDGSGAGHRGLVPSEGRLVQYAADLALRVDEADSVNARLQGLAERYDGYVVSLSDDRSIIRVQRDRMDAAIAEICMWGDVRARSVKGVDVTEEHVDLEARLANARNVRERYLQLLAQAENVTAALAVEKELERVNGEIEAMEGKLAKLTHLVELATIRIELDEKERLGPLGYVFVGTWKGVRWLFVRG